ncbi:hypothetical protein SAMN05216184_101296 [Georgenia satyanarayanai]|uniref:DUF2975 domain-containing protein n=1 Tax=Georgenia satyanarayanai TaxID=860221 RepID=A0A2Y8ZX43_9MICO|nr:hypothetical protein [Georgenia satyanarayanai]PYG01831.1 hypothetical protein A8987_101296 [Georgenia satyanarayanai]SSA36634.1 hypothetical protein SAMN05216184_101296 [Georgenia satyanarayanai]
MSRLLELLLKVWSGVLVASALLWVLPNAVRHWIAELSGGFLRTQFGPTDALYGGIRMGAYFTDGTVDRLVDAMRQNMMLAAHEANGMGFRNQGDVNIGWVLQFFPSGWQHVVHAALTVIPLLVMAVLWWWLATAVAQSRRREVFSLASAHKLTVAGAVIALGGPLLALATWLLYRWVLETSQFGARAEIPAFDLSAVPWGAVAAGLALVVLGTVWRKGAVKERELAGLV